jgi:hypothetical protein
MAVFWGGSTTFTVTCIYNVRGKKPLRKTKKEKAKELRKKQKNNF